MNSKIFKNAALNALGVGAYILVIAYVMNKIQNFLPNMPEYLAAVTMLMLFVFSAALTGYLVLGKPILLYIDGHKKDALTTFGYTLACLFVLVILAILVGYYVSARYI